MDSIIVLRNINKADPAIISAACQKLGWDKPIEQYQTYLQQQEASDRDVVIAEINNNFVGYLTIKWQSGYLPFSRAGIPEINDLNVLPSFRRQGVATSLLDEAEKRILPRSDTAGIGFGLTPDYGPAQILYVKRGYIPNGQGLAKNEQTTAYGDVVTVGHELALYLVKDLGTSLPN